MKHIFTLEPEEKVIAVVRKHWFIFFLEVLSLGVAALAPLIIVVALWLGGTTLPLPISADLIWSGKANTPALLGFLGAGWLTIIWVMLAAAFADYYLDVVILTSKRLIDIEQLGFFARDVATLPHRNIQDIKVETIGFFPTLLRYGNLHIQTAGVNKEVLVRGLPNPEKIKNEILEIILKAKQS